jgi:hypothetical protein
MATTRDDEIEAEARALLRETIQRSRWYSSLPEEKRRRLIEGDVDRHWPVMIQDARKRLEQRQTSDA